MKTSFAKKVLMLLLAVTMIVSSVIPALAQTSFTYTLEVKSAAEMENALHEEADCIVITEGFTVDRTFYVTSDATVLSYSPVTLTRAPDFVGDIFVVGENKDGDLIDEVSLTLGNSGTLAEDYLVIDGNKANMTAENNGTVVFVGNKCILNIHNDVTIKNNNKVTNERTLKGVYGVSYPERIGGGAVIITKGATMNMYGGKIADNSVTDSSACYQGGAVYNYGVMNVYGGTLSGNFAGSGGAIFNYRTLNFYRGDLTGNTAGDTGGALYMPNSTAAFTYFGLENEVAEPLVNIENNSAKGSGALYLRNTVIIKNTNFKNNSATKNGGAISAYAVVMDIENTLFEGNSAVLGAGIYLSDANSNEEKIELTGKNITFNENTASTSGGALYIVNASADIDGSAYNGNTATGSGGAVYLEGTATLKLNSATTKENSTKQGGFAYIKDTSDLKIYSSKINENTATTSNGGGIAVYGTATMGAYATEFNGNTSGGNGGAVFLYNNAAESIIHSCTFKENSSNYGGAIYASSKAVAHIYNATVLSNSATKGGAFYFTTTGTTINLAGVTLSGNSATDGGNIIWGNSAGAVLNIDKSKWVDLGEKGSWDSAYWTNAIYNSLKVKEVVLEVPSYKDYYGKTVNCTPMSVPSDVSSSAELERALSFGHSTIRITDSFTVDRTFYITKNVMIYSPSAVTLTRKDDFIGDIFVVGEDADGNRPEEGVTLTLGNSEATEENLLVIDGNKDNMKVENSGTVIFIVKDSTASLQKDITIKNAKKTLNDRTLSGSYGVSYPEDIGGAAIIVTSGAFLDIYGGNYSYNEGNTDTSGQSFHGGAIYNFGTTNVYGGNFQYNTAGRGGAFYNYRKLHLYNGLVGNNSATTYGGAIYVPASTAAFTYIGEDRDIDGGVSVEQGYVVFENNTAYGSGAIYFKNVGTIKNTLFKGNSATSAGGAITMNASKLTIDSSTFEENTSAGSGGAISHVAPYGEERGLTITNTVFKKNSSNKYGGALFTSEGSKTYITNSDFTDNYAKTYGGAFYGTGSEIEVNGAQFGGNNTDGAGGTITLYDTAKAIFNNVKSTSSASSSQGGFAHISDTADLKIYSSNIKSSTSGGNGGAISVYGTSTFSTYGSTYEENTAGGNGGAIFLYNELSNSIIHSCTFKNNYGNFGGVIYASNKAQASIYNVTAKNNSAQKGGAFYFTTTGTVINLVGITLSGNTATDGGNIIWGNSVGATLNIDKSKYKDEDFSGEYNSDYFATAIVNKLKVYEITEDIPTYIDYGYESYEHMEGAVDVSSSEELENALLSGKKYIRIIKDFYIDRTFYIDREVTIFTTGPHTLTRKADFIADIFVVGESADGQKALLGSDMAVLNLGNSISLRENLLTIDGNKDNMEAETAGSVFFICFGGKVNLYTNVTVMNCHKDKNEKLLTGIYNILNAGRVGGSVAVIANGTLNIYGGNYVANSARAVSEDEEGTDSGHLAIYGGAFYNGCNFNIYGGNFLMNEGAYGGMVYNRCSLRIESGYFANNRASTYGGVIYNANIASSHTIMGSANEIGKGEVVFYRNFSDNHGGAIYSPVLAAMVIYGDTSFVENRALSSSGGAICVYGQFTGKNVKYLNNRAASRGGAVYLSNSVESYVTRYVEFENSHFEGNTAPNGGAIASYASETDFPEGGIANINNCTFVGNIATAKKGAAYGGAIHTERKSILNISNSTFDGNSAKSEGGALYLAGESEVSISDSDIKNNYIAEGGSHGGAICLRSAFLDIDNVNFEGNTSVSNGGAIYVSYQSAREVNSELNMINSTLKNNTAGGNGGAIYATRQTVEEEKRTLSVKNSTFEGNSANTNGGAVYLSTKLDAYFADCSFLSNNAVSGDGGVFSTGNAILKIETAQINNNTSGAHGGAFYFNGAATVTLYEIEGKGNSSNGMGGFLYHNEADLTIYDSVISDNYAASTGGALALYQQGITKVYSTLFENNKSESSGGAVMSYSEVGQNILHSCTFRGNVGAFGGAVYASNKNQLAIYNIVAENNTAQKGGAFYFTTTGTVVDLIGATVSGNSATEGGNIIWGNSKGAVLNIDKSKYKDSSASNLDSLYWQEAIVNELTVKEINGTVPSYSKYKPEKNSSVVTPPTKKPVPVTDVLSLGLSSSDENINSTYNKFPRLDNSRNFMSNGVTTFENINGGTVTVDSFVYQNKAPDGNTNVGLGLLVYQAILFKEANPDEEVYIDVSSYRFSVEAGLCINRNSRYFGYMRNLYSREYDQYGFVRISYLFITAAKMGIHVNIIGHIDGYPISAQDPNLDEYFVQKLEDPCDPAYVENGVIGDYLDFNKCYWSLDEKGGTDMMHTKLCAVSDYLDMNGVHRENAVWTGSSNLDGINDKGYNGNYKVQTATIVSGHEDIYRVSTNYLRLIADYCGQEEVYEFQDIVNRTSTEQIDLINAGRESEIAPEKQLVYLGSEEDDVFELYFTPFGGGTLAWEEDYNPYCKYLRKLYDSDDYIIFTWNAAEYTGNWALGRQIEAMLTEAFHKNRNVNNKIFGTMENFDSTVFDDLVVGVDIGYKSFNELPFGTVHNKDIIMSYSENGQRYYVSLLNSMNFHSGSMCYQSNFMLVIKEKDYSEQSVYFNMLINSTTGIVDHQYGDLKESIPVGDEEAYLYKECIDCGKQIIEETIHNPGEWIIDREATEEHFGIRHKECRACGVTVVTGEYEYEVVIGNRTDDIHGITFEAGNECLIPVSLSSAPRTFEATVRVPKGMSSAGTILGNYGQSGDNLRLEVATYGRVKLTYKTNGYETGVVFATDIRSDKAVHIVVTADETTAKLYVDSVLKETKKLYRQLPFTLRGLTVGGETLGDNANFFKGTLYSVALFSDERTESEIKNDGLLIKTDCDNLLYCENFSGETKGILSTTGDALGKTFSADTLYTVDKTFESAPKTYEAVISMPKGVNTRGGVIFGNYSDNEQENQINLEVYNHGRIRLYYNNAGVKTYHVFTTDIRSNEAVHIAVTVEGRTASLYVDGTLKETATLKNDMPDARENFCVGGDRRTGNAQYYKYEIYSVNIFSDVRTEKEIESDAVAVKKSAEDLVYSAYFVAETDSLAMYNYAFGGKTFTADNKDAVSESLSSAPSTIEAVISLPNSFSDRAGVIVGNYNDKETANHINLEIYNEGKVRLFFNENGVKNSYLFNTDIRSDTPTYIAVTIEEGKADLYVNGIFKESVTLTTSKPQATANYYIGGDARKDQYFKGKILSLKLFSDIRTAEEIMADGKFDGNKGDGLLYGINYLYDNEEGTAIKSDAVYASNYSKTHINRLPYELKDNFKTFEATLNLPMGTVERGGVIFGNYDGTYKGDMINLEVYYLGKLRLFYVKDGKKYEYKFTTDIRSDKIISLAITFEDKEVKVYIDGILTETALLEEALPQAIDNFCLGGDNRDGNAQYFKGTIYSVNLFSDIRTESEVQSDAFAVSAESDNLVYSAYLATKRGEALVLDSMSGRTFGFDRIRTIKNSLSGAPKTIEATIQIPIGVEERCGVIFGNYYGSEDSAINLEIYSGGRVRLFVKNGSVKSDCVFSADIRSENAVHIAVTVDGLTASLYVNGKFSESKELTVALPAIKDGFCVGGDNRINNVEYFKYRIYSVSVFSDIRTAEEIVKDKTLVTSTADKLLYSEYFTTDSSITVTAPQNDSGKTFSQDKQFNITDSFESSPLTFEAKIKLHKSIYTRAGILIGNSDDTLTKDQISFEIYTYGRVRLYYVNGSEVGDCIFKTDIRSNSAVHIAVTVEGNEAKLYVDGKLAESKTLTVPLPQVQSGYCIGGDNREGNIKFFNGEIYTATMFSKTRTVEEIRKDIKGVALDTDGLLYHADFNGCHNNPSGKGHVESDWIVDLEKTETEKGIKHKECVLCSHITEVSEIGIAKEDSINYYTSEGYNPTADNLYKIEDLSSATPLTFEATFKLAKTFKERAGIVVGNYDGSAKNQVNVEIYDLGKVRLYYNIGGVAYRYTFKADIRSDDFVHIAVTIDGTKASLYVNGVLSETGDMGIAPPENTDGYCVGGDYRKNNEQYFKGTIYSVSLFSDIRTAEEIKYDALYVTRDADSLLYNKYFAN